jgi:rRNA maturation RNase YbeY
LNLRIFYDDINYRIKGWRKVIKILERIILDANRIPGDIKIIITNDSALKTINTQFLKHNYFTDVITFNYCLGNVVNGEVYISIDTVKINALNYKVSLNEEIRRVIIHGILHLVDYDDKFPKDRIVMRKKEDFWLSLFED